MLGGHVMSVVPIVDGINLNPLVSAKFFHKAATFLLSSFFVVVEKENLDKIIGEVLISFFDI